MNRLLTTILAATMLILLALVLPGCKKQVVHKQQKGELEERIAELTNIKNEMGLKDNEQCYKWDGIAAKFYLDHQSGRPWKEIQKSMLSKDFLATWIVTKKDRNYMAVTLFPLLQRADDKERPSGAFTLNETMDLAHALCGEKILTGGILPFRYITYLDAETAEALVFSGDAK